MITHRAKLLLLTLASTLATSLLMAAPTPAPQEHPPRPGQPEYCTVNHKDAQYVCKCLDHDMGAGCAMKDDGQRGRKSEEGMSGVCLSHCRISHCHCCLS